MSQVKKIEQIAREIFGELEVIHKKKGKITHYKLIDSRERSCGELANSIRDYKMDIVNSHLRSLGAILKKSNGDSYYYTIHNQLFRISNHKPLIYYHDRTHNSYIIKYHTNIDVVIEDINNRIQSLIV